MYLKSHFPYTLSRSSLVYLKRAQWYKLLLFYFVVLSRKSMHTKSLLSCPAILHAYSPPGSSLHEILQARILDWIAMLSSKGSSQLRDQTYVFCVHRSWQASSLSVVPSLPGSFYFCVQIMYIYIYLCKYLCKYIYKYIYIYKTVLFEQQVNSWHDDILAYAKWGQREDSITRMIKIDI